MLKRTLAGLIVAIAMGSSAIAGPLEDANAAYGRGDYAVALGLFRPLAEQGNVLAQMRLGDMYLWGRGAPEDYAASAKWYRLAAEQGNTQAQAVLGSSYADGIGVPRDYVLAHMWFNLAATWETIDDLRSFYARRRGELEKQMTPDQIAEAQHMAREWKPTTAK